MIRFVFIVILMMLAACQAPVVGPAPASSIISPTDTPISVSATIVQPTDTPSDEGKQDSMEGVWIQSTSRDDAFMQLNADGTFAIAVLFNDLEKFPYIKGTYEIDDDTLTLNVDPDGVMTCAGKTAKYNIVQIDPDRFLLEKREWDCRDFSYFASDTMFWEPYVPADIPTTEPTPIPDSAIVPLPERSGPRTQTSGTVPHIQIGVEPVTTVNDELFRRAFALPGVEDRPTIVSLPGARGMWLSDDISLAHPEAIVALQDLRGLTGKTALDLGDRAKSAEKELKLC